MERTVNIGDKNVRLKFTGGTLCRYKEQFQIEYYTECKKARKLGGNEKIQAAERIGFRLIWALAKTADNDIPDPVAWIKEFKSFPVVEIMPIVNDMIDKSFSTIKSQSEYSDGREFTSENLMASCLACGFTAADIDGLSIGFLINTIGEYCRIKSGKSAPKDVYRKATKADYDAF